MLHGQDGVFMRTATKVYDDAFFLKNSLNVLISIQGTILLSLFRILREQQEMVDSALAEINLQLTKYLIKRR